MSLAGSYEILHKPKRFLEKSPLLVSEILFTILMIVFKMKYKHVLGGIKCVFLSVF